MWRCPLGLLLLLLLAGELTLGARRGRGRRELAPGLHLRGIRDAGGRYCGGQDLCCRGRADDCALPYLGATCYCDLFCNRTVSDCCPDFWDFCLGVPPPFPPIPGGHQMARRVGRLVNPRLSKAQERGGRTAMSRGGFVESGESPRPAVCGSGTSPSPLWSDLNLSSKTEREKILGRWGSKLAQEKGSPLPFLPVLSPCQMWKVLAPPADSPSG